ncbi:hypothetical protein D3C73_666230 [compost metagenome]
MADGGQKLALHPVLGFGMLTSLLDDLTLTFFPTLQDEAPQGQPQQQQDRCRQQRQQPGGLRLHAVFIYGINQVAAIDNPFIAQRLQRFGRDLHQIFIEDSQQQRLILPHAECYRVGDVIGRERQFYRAGIT